MNEAKVQRTATIKQEADTEITRRMEKTLKDALKLTEAIEAEKAKFQEAIKIKELELKSKQAEIMETMKEMDTTTLKFKKILATIESSKGRVTHSYANLWNFALLQATEQQKKALVEYQEVNKKINPDKLTLTIKKLEENFLNEGLKEMITGIWDFLKKKAQQIREVFSSYADSVDALESVVKASKI